jgi:hypothetical protein
LVVIDDAITFGFARLYSDETTDSALASLAACERFYGEQGIHIERVLTDNGIYFNRRWQETCQRAGVAVRKMWPYRRQTTSSAHSSSAGHTSTATKTNSRASSLPAAGCGCLRPAYGNHPAAKPLESKAFPVD